MIQVRVRQYNRIDVLGLNDKMLPVQLAQVLQSWKSPQSIRMRVLPYVIRCLEPVTVPAPPRLVSESMKLSPRLLVGCEIRSWRGHCGPCQNHFEIHASVAAAAACELFQPVTCAAA